MIEFAGVTRSANVEHAIQRGFGKMGVADTFAFVVADFSRVVAELTGDTAYQATKLDGSAAAARTVLHKGQPVVVFSELAVSTGAKALERVAAHEAGHVHLHRRGEASTDEMAGGPNQILRGLADIGIEEWRCERAAHMKGYKPAGALSSTLSHVSYRIVQAWTEPLDILERTRRTVNLMQSLVVAFAYHAGSRRTFPGSDVERLYRDESWLDLMQLWERLAPADEIQGALTLATERASAETLTVRALRALGFEFRDPQDEQGFGFFRVIDGDELTHRMEVGFAWLEENEPESLR
ncbi:hypothetical protein UB45_10985 [Terrabacter sp. 28]|nr:hypothetical protein UB45_10985 [Terrabacter sp. 28]